VMADLAKMPHLLIAGATGAGKSVCLNAIITGLLMRFSPNELRLVLVDPKRVELTPYANIPHLAFSNIVVDMDRVVGTLQAIINEMESRYRRFAAAGVRDLRRYNEVAVKSGGVKLPYWVVVVDELADLMLVAPYQVENQIVRLAQLARATGIHLIIATQRPSVDVVTGLIKANFPTRIAFAMSSMVDSRTVLDQGGAEKLLGRGDMLFVPPDAQKPRRVQGVFLSDAEIEAVVNFWTADRFAELVPEKHDDLLEEAEHQAQAVGEDKEADPMVERAIALALELKTISVSMLQRRLRVGYPRAARIMDALEERGIVGPSDGSNSRPVVTSEGIIEAGDSVGVAPPVAPSAVRAPRAARARRAPVVELDDQDEECAEFEDFDDPYLDAASHIDDASVEDEDAEDAEANLDLAATRRRGPVGAAPSRRRRRY
jgi:DNA segregation ATPase FtsK/SpoIIIE, S-DNA-T family